MAETFNVYESWLDHDEIESKIIWFEKDCINLDLSQEIRNDIKISLLDSISQLPLEKQRSYKSEYKEKALKSSWVIKGIYYELAAWIINVISTEKNQNIIPQKNQNTVQENNESLTNIDFSVQNVSAKVYWKKYILNQRYSPDIIKLGNNKYELILVMKRDSNSSLRWDQKISLNFTYDWYRLIFFNDKNNNWNIDKHEWGILTRIDHKNERKIDRNQWTIYHRGNSEIIKLDKNQISENWVKNLILQLYFQ
jgi:hypothetical protein